MDKPAPIITIIFCAFMVSGWSQESGYRYYDYTKVDAHARSLKEKYRDLDKLASDVTNSIEKEHEKVRAIFAWIANNIAYDTKAVHRKQEPVTFTYSSEEELKQLLAQQDQKVVLEVLKEGKAVCDGYARLFRTLCEKNGIRAEIIDGYARNNPGTIGKVVSGSNHSWNSVLLDNRWYLLDPTWGSGYTDPEVTRFTRDFRPGYFFTSPEKMILDHFPDDPKWQLLDKPVSRKEFFDFPLVKAGLLKYNISGFSPAEGIVIARKDKAIEFGFTSDQNIQEILLHEQNEQYSKPTTFSKQGARYSFQYIPEKKGNYILTIFVNGESTLMYRVEVR